MTMDQEVTELVRRCMLQDQLALRVLEEHRVIAGTLVCAEDLHTLLRTTV